MQIIDFLLKKFRPKEIVQFPSTNVRLWAAIEKSREIGLCERPDCTTGCVGIFRKLVKEALADEHVDIEYWRALEPHIREPVQKFCAEKADELSYVERRMLMDFAHELDPRIPSEAVSLKKINEAAAQNYERRKKEWRKEVEEKRAEKKRMKQLRHQERLRRKYEDEGRPWS